MPTSMPCLLLLGGHIEHKVVKDCNVACARIRQRLFQITKVCVAIPCFPQTVGPAEWADLNVFRLRLTFLYSQVEEGWISLGSYLSELLSVDWWVIVIMSLQLLNVV